MEFTLFLHYPIQVLKGSPSIMVLHVLGGTSFLIHVRERGHDLQGETKAFNEGYCVPG